MNRYNKWVKERRKKLRKEFGGKCTYCNSTEKLEFAHIKDTPLSLEKLRGRGRKERLYDIIKHPDCYILLCQKCHRKLDSR